jgi:hypothetical protein
MHTPQVDLAPSGWKRLYHGKLDSNVTVTFKNKLLFRDRDCDCDCDRDRDRDRNLGTSQKASLPSTLSPSVPG